MKKVLVVVLFFCCISAFAQRPPYTQTKLESLDTGGWLKEQWLVYGLGPVGNGWELWYHVKSDRNLHNCCDNSYLASVGFWYPEYYTQLSPTNSLMAGCNTSYNQTFANLGWFNFTSSACSAQPQIGYTINDGYGFSSPDESDSVAAYTTYGQGH